jgi:integrase
MENVKCPRQRKKEMAVLVAQEVAVLRAAAKERKKGMPLCLPILLMAATGVRRNEALGSRWLD